MQLKDSSLLKSHCYVNGEWIGTGETPVTNPATGEEITRVPYFGADETRAAIAHAKGRLSSPGRPGRPRTAPGSCAAGTT